MQVDIRNWRTAIASTLVMAVIASPSTGDKLPGLNREVFVTGTSSPIAFIQDPSNPTVQYVVQQRGIIRVVQDGQLQTFNHMDLSDRVSPSGNERGLLGMALPQNYAQEGLIYVNYTRNSDGATIISKFRRRPANPLRGRENSEDIIMVIPQDFSNHNGGNIAFGPDGYLYIGMGDGGSANDPNNRAQTTNTLLGKMLRIDVRGDDFPNDDFRDYAIPADNPFVDDDPIDAPEEIWAFGMRNPWRWSFDDPALGGTGAMVVGDVGQFNIEELNYEPADAGGRNYGWSRFEGLNLWQAGRQLIYGPHAPPITQYTHSGGRCSVTGGFIYRGHALGSQYRGRYFYADFCTGEVWSVGLSLDENGEATVTDTIEHTGDISGGFPQCTAFGVDAEGELYGVSRTGTIYKLVPETNTSITDVSMVEGTLVSGGVDELERIDDQNLVTEAAVTGEAAEAHRIQVDFGGTTDATDPCDLDIRFALSISDIMATQVVFLWNWDTGDYEQVARFNVTMEEGVYDVQVSEPASYIRDSDGRIEMRVRQFVVTPFTLGGYRTTFDQVSFAAN